MYGCLYCSFLMCASSVFFLCFIFLFGWGFFCVSIKDVWSQEAKMRINVSAYWKHNPVTAHSVPCAMTLHLLWMYLVLACIDTAAQMPFTRAWAVSLWSKLAIRSSDVESIMCQYVNSCFPRICFFPCYENSSSQWSWFVCPAFSHSGMTINEVVACADNVNFNDALL